MTCKTLRYCELLYYVSFVLVYMKLSLRIKVIKKNCNVKLDHGIVFFWSGYGFWFYYCSNSEYKYSDDVTKYNAGIFRFGLEKDCGIAKIPSSYTSLAVPLHWASITS